MCVINKTMAEEIDAELRKDATNTFVDKVTLELLMNKNHYNRYLSQTDPKKHQEYLEHLHKVKKYRSGIMNMTIDFLDNPNHQVTTEVNEAFYYYMRTLVRHFDCKRMESEGKNEDHNTDENMLFGEMDTDKEEQETDHIPTMHSFWGKHKVQKKSSYYHSFIPRIGENSASKT